MFTIYLIIGTLNFVFSTISLAAALWIIGTDDGVHPTDPFKTDGVGPTLTKCCCISAVQIGLWMFLPYGIFIGVLVWFGAVMMLFDKSFLSALLISLVGAAVSYGLEHFLRSMVEAAVG